MIQIPLNEWQYIALLCPEVSQVPLLNKVQAFKEQGIDVVHEYQPYQMFLSRFVAVFDNETDAAVFKLKHL